jgi:hypothetical protein
MQCRKGMLTAALLKQDHHFRSLVTAEAFSPVTLVGCKTINFEAGSEAIISTAS